MTTEPLIDIGVNLTHKSFRNDCDNVLARAASAGVTTLIITGTSEPGSRQARVLAATRPGVLYATAGVHPHHARDCTETTLDTLRSLAEMPEVVAVGECGLDFNRNFSPPPVQEKWFDAQVELAAEIKKPMFLHERDAHARLLSILREHRKSLTGAVVHCFTGSGAELDAYLDLDLHIGITGWICDERRGLHLRALLPRIPLNRLMIETDAPFLVPRTMAPRPSRNEPAFLPHVLAATAAALALPQDEVARATTATACAFFGIPSPARLATPIN
jgi:TatD DNase family protein